MHYHNNSISFNDKFSFADKVTFESEKFKNDEILNFNQYIKTEPENETINNESMSVYSKKIIKNSNCLKKKENSSFTSEKLVNDSVMSEKTLQSYQFSIQDTLQTKNIKDVVNNNSISNTIQNDNHYLQIIQYKLQHKEDNRISSFHSHNNDLEKTRNDMQNSLRPMTVNSNSFQQNSSLNTSILNSTLNTQKKETTNLNKMNVNNTISTSSTIPKKNYNNNTNINNKIKISNKNFDSNKNDLNKFLSKKDVHFHLIQDSKNKDIKNNIQKKQTKLNNTKINLNLSKDELDNSNNKKIVQNSKSKDKKSTLIPLNEIKADKLSTVSVDKINKHVKTSSVCSVKNLKNNDLLSKYE